MKLAPKQKKLIKEYIKRLTEDTNESYEDIFNKLPWSEVSKHISKQLKIPELVKLQYNFKSPSHVKITSPDLIKYCGIFSIPLGHCYVDFFNSSIITDPSKNIYFWGTIDLIYPGNGLQIATVWIDKNLKIIYKPSEPRMST